MPWQLELDAHSNQAKHRTHAVGYRYACVRFAASVRQLGVRHSGERLADSKHRVDLATIRKGRMKLNQVALRFAQVGENFNHPRETVVRPADIQLGIPDHGDGVDRRIRRSPLNNEVCAADEWTVDEQGAVVFEKLEFAGTDLVKLDDLFPELREELVWWLYSQEKLAILFDAPNLARERQTRGKVRFVAAVEILFADAVARWVHVHRPHVTWIHMQHLLGPAIIGDRLAG
mmetsp:Transcript_9331/g.29806  ORF Transcript_9331/g.29806 Transcript_9331/m.29806 type:complete len:231 (-) Transcript_9331:1705-2397(-)